MENKIMKFRRAFRIIEDNPKGEDEKQKSYSESASPRRSHSLEEDNAYGIIFWATVAISQIIGVALIVLLVVWGNKYGGFVATDPKLIFNYHPLFMVLGLVVCYGDAIIVYRVLRFLPKPLLKIIHAALHILAIVFSSLALVAVFENHRRLKMDDLYSLHSWIGILAFGAFCLQYIGGFVVFLYPGLPANWRAKIMPFHLFFGVGIFVMSVAAAGMGLTEKLLWTSGYSKLHAQGIIGNLIGLLILVFSLLIVFLATHSTYKRKPLPNEVPNFTTN
ncbi:transmembrane ascorbate-dependent reductase CYB561 isoform X2 [Parasteatoda tepidariorum]|uniref:transmembrane ascorbate-dependent reductase CYB561 isoform X2 n=1 Tax=Parasteatoda tepidariorum TaxID=114398 RepID=UPI0039BD1588